MRRKRIVFITTGLALGGAETMLFHMLRKMDRDRFEPAVVSLMDRGKYGDIIAALDVPVEAVGMRPGRPSLSAFMRLAGMVKRAQPDLLQGWMYHGNLAAQILGGICKVPTVCCIHNSFNGFASEKPLTRVALFLTARMARRARKVVFVSYASQSQHEMLGFPASNACVIPNGVDTGLFKPSPVARDAVRKELGLAPGTTIIGLMGRFHPQKDHANFLRAAAGLCARRPDVHYVLAGPGVDGENAVLTGMARIHGIAGNVHLLGVRDDMPRLVAAMDLVSSSSSYGEAHPLAIVEAMSCGVPCAVTDVGDCALLVGSTGMVVSPRDPEGLARAWECFLQLPAEQRRQLGVAARDRILEHYSIERAIKSYEELYSSLN